MGRDLNLFVSNVGFSGMSRNLEPKKISLRAKFSLAPTKIG